MSVDITLFCKHPSRWTMRIYSALLFVYVYETDVYRVYSTPLSVVVRCVVEQNEQLTMLFLLFFFCFVCCFYQCEYCLQFTRMRMTSNEIFFALLNFVFRYFVYSGVMYRNRGIHPEFSNFRFVDFSFLQRIFYSISQFIQCFDNYFNANRGLFSFFNKGPNLFIDKNSFCTTFNFI